MSLAILVDDQADVRLLLRHFLHRAGLDTVEAGGGPEALALLGLGEEADLVLLDVQMPDMDGWATLSEIRRRCGPGRPAVLLCTVRSSPADVLRGYELGCDGYIAKPFDPPDLVAEVRRVLACPEPDRVATRRERLRDARRSLALTSR